MTKLVMTYKVRDEADVLEENLRFHRALGVDFFIVTDNGSVDGTREILERWADAGLARVIDAPDEPMSSAGHRWLTEMARLAAEEHGADWVLHNDADEFWWPLEGTLRETLAAIPEEFGAVLAPRVEFVGRPDGPGTFVERLTYREAHGRLRPKVAHRARADAVVLHRGGHDVVAAPTGNPRDSLRPPGRAVLRTVRGADAGDDRALALAPIWPIQILHFPVRSFDQYRRRVELGLAAFPDQKSWSQLRRAYENDKLEWLYKELTYDDAAVAEGLRAGALVEDTRLRDFLPTCPDPFAADFRELAPPAPPPDELERMRAALAADAMRVIGRYSRLFEVRLGESRERIREVLGELDGARKEMRAQRRKAKRRGQRIRKLRRTQRKLRAELRAERRRPWSRARRLAHRAAARVARLFGRGNTADGD
ncbi:MAG TPA: glycosyltransferase family 2 protein [Solirubrobacterales bacterium]